MTLRPASAGAYLLELLARRAVADAFTRCSLKRCSTRHMSSQEERLSFASHLRTLQAGIACISVVVLGQCSS